MCPHFQRFPHIHPKNKTQGPTSASFALASLTPPQAEGLGGDRGGLQGDSIA